MITWQQVVTSPRFQKLAEPEKRKVQQSFFDQYVAPAAAENGYDLEQVGKQFNERATSLWYTPPEPVEVNNAFEPTADSDSTSAPVAPKRTWTEAATDLPKDVAAGTLEMAAGVTGLGRRLLAMREDRNNQAMREEYGTTTPLTTSALVESKPGAFEAAAKGTADVIREGQSDKRQWQRQQLQDAPGALEAAAFLISNPTALASLAAESATSMFAAGGFGGALAKGASVAGASQAATKTLATIGAMVGEGALSAGAIGNEVEDLLNKQGITDPALRKSAIDIANTAGVVTGYLGRIGAGVEVMPFMRESIKESLLKAVPKAMSKEAAEEFVQSYSETVAKNLALGQAGATDESGKAITNLTQDAAKQGVIGAMAGAASGGAMPVISRGLDRLQTASSPQAAAQEILSQPSASTVPLTGDLKADLAAINNAPVTPLESLAAALKSAQLNPIGVENATQPISVPTPAGAGAGAQADNLVNAGNNDLARVDVAPTGILAQAPAVEGNPLPPNQTQAGQTAQGATDNTRSLEQASQDQQVANPSIDGLPKVKMPETPQPADSLTTNAQTTPKGTPKSDTVAIAEKARLRAAQDGAAAFANGVERQLPAEYASGFNSLAGRARGKAWFQGWDQANAGLPVGEQNVGTNSVADNGPINQANGTPSVSARDGQASVVAGRQDVSDSPAASVQPQLKDFADSKGRIKTFANEKSAKLYLRGNKSTLRGYTPRKDGGDWILSKPIKAKSEAQLKAEAQRKKDSVTPYPERDNLWTAIAKLGGLDHKEASATWGIDLADRFPSGVYQKPTLRYGGLSIADIEEKLGELGYLPKDENGKVELQAFEDAFKNGNEHYTAQGNERRAALSEDARYQEEMAKYRESAADVVESTPEAENLDADTLDAAIEMADDLADDVFLGRGNMTEIDAMRALGFTDEEINETTTAYNQARQSEARETTDREAPASPESGAGTSQESPTEVTPQTPADAGKVLSGITKDVGSSSFLADSEPSGDLQVGQPLGTKTEDQVNVNSLGGVQPESGQLTANVAAVHAKTLADFLKSKPLTSEASGGINAKSQRVVLRAVFSLGQNLKIRNAIIEAIPVDVMNLFAPQQLTPQVLFNDISVFENAFSPNGEFAVAVRRNPSIARDVAFAATNTAAKVFGFKGELAPASDTLSSTHFVTPNSDGMLGDKEADTSLSPPIVSARSEQSNTPPESGNTPETRADTGEPTPMQAAASRAADAMRAAADAFELAAQTPEQLAEIEAKKKAAEEAKAKADREAAEKESKENERKTVQNRMEGANADFQLGQSAEENLSGQRGMFDTILPAKLFPRFEFPAGKADPATAMEDAKRILGINGSFPMATVSLPQLTPARVNTATRKIEIDPSQFSSRSHAAQAMAEEILHAIDLVAPNTTISATSKRLAIGGDIRTELSNHFREKGEYADWLRYPLHPTFFYLSQDRFQAELFARMGVAYNGDPEGLKSALPKTYEAFHGIYRLVREGGYSDAWLRNSLPKFTFTGADTRGGQADGERLAGREEGGGGIRAGGEADGLGGFYQKLADAFDGRPDGRVISDSDLETTTPSDEGVSTSTLFSRGQSLQSLAPTDAKAAVDVIKSKWKNSPKINVWESFDQAPAGLRDEIERAGAQDARGAWHGGEIHLFPQNIPNLAVLERTLVHESRHAGLEGVFGRDLNPVLMNLYLKNAELRREVNALQKKTGLNTVNQINEVLADKPLDYAQKLSGWKQVVGKMKEWFEKNGFTRLAAMLDGPTADELVKDVLYQAEEFIRSGKKSTTLTGGAMFDMGSPIQRLADFWQEYAARDDAFRYPKSDSTSIEGIVNDLGATMFTPEMKYRDYKVLDADFVGETDGELLPMLMAKTEDGRDAEFATLNFDPDGNGRSLFIRINDTDRFKRDVNGARAYQAMMTWAVNNGYQLNPDSELLPVNRLRRTEAQINMMLKYDSRAGQIAPHEEQYIGLLSDSDFADTISGKMDSIAPGDIREKLKKMKDRLWRNPETGATREEKREIFTTNLENLLIASSALAERRVKALADLTVTDGQIRNELTNEPVLFDPKSKDDLERSESRRAGAKLGKVVVFTRGFETGVGETTASRAVYTSSVLSRNVPWSALFRDVAAKRDERLSNPKERNGLLALGGEGLVSDSRVQAALDSLPARALYSRGVVNSSREDLSNFNRYDAANDKPSQALRDAIKKFERETPGFQIDPLGNSRVIVTRLKKDDLVSSLKTLKEFGDANNVAVGISSKTASYTDFPESSGFRLYIQRADDEIGGLVSYEHDSNHFARIVGVYVPISLEGEVRFSRAPQTDTLAFRKWFGDSKVVNPDGTPMVVYHGTSRDFSEFAIEGQLRNAVRVAMTAFAAKLNPEYSTRRAKEKATAFFTDSPRLASMYSQTSDSPDRGFSPNVMPVYLALQKPLIIDFENKTITYPNGKTRENVDLGLKIAALQNENALDTARREGADGVIMRGVRDGEKEPTNLYIAFNSTQIKSAVGNNGNFDPNNPDIRFSRTRDDEQRLNSANAAAEYGIAKVTRMALGQKMIKEIVSNPGKFNVINKTLNTQLHKALKNKEFGKVFWAGQQFMEDVSQLASQAAELAPEILPNYGNIKNLGMALRDTVNPLKSSQRNKDIKAAGAAIFDGTMEGGGNPLEGRIFTDQELSDAKLSPEAITFYKQSRQVIDKSLDDLSMSEVVRMLGERVKIEPAMMEFLKSNPNQFRAGLLDAIATARENAAPEMVPGWKDIEKRAQETFQHADALKAAGYAPLMRFGKYFVTVREEGETIYRAHYENRLDLNAAMKELKAKYPRSEVSKGTISEKDFKLMKGMTPETIMLFAGKLGLPMDMQKAAQQYYREAVSARSAMKRRIERKGIAGYSDDLPRVLAGFVTSNARRAAANYNMPIIKGAIDNIDQDAGDVRDEAMEMVEQIESPTEDAAALRGLMYAYFIGGSLASAMVNMTQPLTMTLPYLCQWGNAKASAALVKALRTNSKLPQNLKDALKLANEKGITDPNEVYYLYQETIRGISSNRTFQKGMGLWSAMFSIAENLNRRTTFLAAYDMWDSADAKTRAEMTKTTGANDGFAFAKRTVQETQGIYNKCVDKDTEMLTAAGWKRVDQLVPGEAVYSVDSNGALVKDTLQKVHRYEGVQQVVELRNSNGLSIVTTPAHDHLIQNYNSRDQKWQSIRKVKTDALKQSHHILRAPLADGLERTGVYSDDEVRLFAWVAAEGHLFAHRSVKEKRGVGLVQSQLHNPQYVIEIDDLLGRLGGHFNRKTSRKGEMVCWQLRKPLWLKIHEALPGKMLTHDLVGKLTVPQMAIFLETFTKADGHFPKVGGQLITQKDIGNLNVLQAMSVLTGRSSTVYERMGEHEFGAIYVAKNSIRAHVKAMTETTFNVDMVWCPQTTQGTWIARRNGRTFVTGNSNRPNWARGAIGATLMTFKQYTVAYLELLSRLPMQQKMVMLAMLFLLSGLGGLPGEEDAEDLIDTIGQAMGYNTNSKMFIRQKVADLIGETFMPIVMQGVSGMPGFPADIGGRLGMANILPGTSLFQRSESNSTDKEIAEAIGPIAGIVKNFNNAKKAAESGEWFDAMANAAPNAIGNALKGAKIGQTGEMTDYKDRKTVEGLDMSHAFFKFIGFNPKPVADEGRISRMIGQDTRLLKDVEADISDKLAKAIKNGDDEKQERALAELDEWNEKNPDTPIVITRQQINRRIKDMETDRATRQMKTIPKEARGYYLDNVK